MNEGPMNQRPMNKHSLNTRSTLAILAISVALLAPFTFAAEGRMLKPGTRTHVVANLEKSVAFYRDAVGLDLVKKPAPLAESLLLSQVRTINPKAKARSATFEMPGSEMLFQLVEFSGVKGTHITQHLYDPGAARFSMQVRDIQAGFDRAKKYGIKVHSTGGGPVYTQRPRNNTRAVMMEDPDGFIFEFTQADPVPESPVPAGKNIINVRVSPVVEDMNKSVAFYRDLLGFKLRPTNEVNEAVRALEGTPDAVVRTTLSDPPGTNNFWVIWEFTKLDRKRLDTHVQDPGATSVSLWVENLPELLKTMKAAGVVVETKGGEPIPVEKGVRGVLIRTPDGLLLELLEKVG
jgi:catechol 2,3-dioxygenase-like lactoylglutathione lyase family enzyme